MENTKNITLNLNSSYTIKIVEKKIQEQKRISIEQQCLVFNRQLLEDDKTLSEYGIKNESTRPLSKKIQISVLTMDEERIPLQVKNTDIVGDVKKKIYEKIGTPVEMQELLFYRKILENDTATLSNCNIINGCTLHLVRNLAGYYKILNFKT